MSFNFRMQDMYILKAQLKSNRFDVYMHTIVSSGKKYLILNVYKCQLRVI